MIKKDLLVGGLLLYSFAHGIEAAYSKSRTSQDSKRSTASITDESLNPEERTIEEIRKLFNKGKMPEVGFNKWVDAHKETLLSSKKPAVRKLGVTLSAIRDKRMDEVQGTHVLSEFTNAVKAYHPDFAISPWAYPGLLVRGTAWYFTK